MQHIRDDAHASPACRHFYLALGVYSPAQVCLKSTEVAWRSLCFSLQPDTPTTFNATSLKTYKS